MGMLQRLLALYTYTEFWGWYFSQLLRVLMKSHNIFNGIKRWFGVYARQRGLCGTLAYRRLLQCKQPSRAGRD
jgi:hypothetical protein